MVEESLMLGELVQIDPENYLVALAGAVDLHKFERDYQDFSQPRILMRMFEENGFVAGFDINEDYRTSNLRDKVNDIISDMEINRVEKIQQAANWLISEDDNLYLKLQAMHLSDQMEGSLYDMFVKRFPNRFSQVSNLPPFFVKTYDDLGMPISYCLNESVFEQVRDDKTTMIYSVKQLPISIKGNKHDLGDITFIDESIFGERN